MQVVNDYSTQPMEVVVTLLRDGECINLLAAPGTYVTVDKIRKNNRSQTIIRYIPATPMVPTA